MASLQYFNYKLGTAMNNTSVMHPLISAAKVISFKAVYHRRAADLRHRRYRSLGCRRVVESVRFEDIEFTKVGRRKVSVYLMFINNSLRQRLLRHLTVIDLLLHSALTINHITHR